MEIPSIFRERWIEVCGTSRAVVRIASIASVIVCTSVATSESYFSPGNNHVSFRVMSYNIHYGRGNDGSVDLRRIAEVIRKSGADVVALNEVDRYFARSGRIDQIKWLAEHLNMDYAYQATFRRPLAGGLGADSQEHGHGILSKFPIEHANPRLYAARDKYRRGILESRITIDNLVIYFYVTHWSMGVDPAPRISQAEETLAWMNETSAPRLLLGDLNALPDADEIRLIEKCYADAFDKLPESYTFPSDKPTKRIDYIFGSRDFQFANTEVVSSLASDHLAIVTDVVFTEEIRRPARDDPGRTLDKR